MKFKEITQIIGLLFSTEEIVLKFGKNVSGFFLGVFLTNTSGHPAFQ
jgi:hypothetical protein